MPLYSVYISVILKLEKNYVAKKCLFFAAVRTGFVSARAASRQKGEELEWYKIWARFKRHLCAIQKGGERCRFSYSINYCIGTKCKLNLARKVP